MHESNSLQPLNLVYSHNIVTKTIAYIFINTETKSSVYKNADERGNIAIELLAIRIYFFALPLERCRRFRGNISLRELFPDSLRSIPLCVLLLMLCT